MIGHLKSNSFLIGEFIFILNSDWMGKKQLDVNQSFLKTVDNKRLKEIRIPVIVGVNVPVLLYLYISHN